MFPLVVRENLFEPSLGLIKTETQSDIPKTYRELLTSTIHSFTNHPDNIEACKKYMLAANIELLEKSEPTINSNLEPNAAENSILDDENTYRTDLLNIFYRRVLARVIGKSRKRGIKAADYFTVNNLENLSNVERETDIKDAITDELTEVTRINKRHQLHKLNDPDINVFKHHKNWFKKVNNDVVLEVIEVLTDAADKGNSLGKKISHYMPLKAAEVTPDDHNKPHMPSGFDIAGIVVSALYLSISIITPLYKKFALKRSDPIINRWSMRYFLPSVALFTLGILAFTMPVVGMWAGLGFSGYSLASNIFKVIYYFYAYNDLSKRIEANRIKIENLAAQREALNQQIIQLKQEYKSLKITDDPDAAKNKAELIQQKEREYKELTRQWLKQTALKDELDVERIRTQNKFTGFLNIARLLVVCTAVAGAILSVIPPLAPIGGIMLFTTLCLSTALVTAHYINKFILIREEKNRARRLDALYQETIHQSTSLDIMQKLAEKSGKDNKDKELNAQPDNIGRPLARNEAEEIGRPLIKKHRQRKHFWCKWGASKHDHENPVKDQDVANNSVFGF